MTGDFSGIVLLANLAATLYMTGLIWFVQLVHYPLFTSVGGNESPVYATRHQERTTLAVAPMVLEAAAALALLVVRPVTCPAWVAWTGLGIVVSIWASTAFVQVPLHGRLALAHEPASVEKLVATNWVRTILWTLRAVLMLWVVGRELEGRP